MIIYKEAIIGHLFKCAGTSVGYKLRQEDPMNIAYFSGHDSIKVLNSPSLSFAKDYQQYALVRNPLTFYESFYNYVNEFVPQKAYNHDSISKFLMFKENKEPYSLSEYVERCMDIGKTLNDSHLSDIKELFKRSQGYYTTWIPDMSNYKFPNISFYQWDVQNILKDDCKTFKMETEIDDFLLAIGSTKGLPKKNVTGERHNKDKRDFKKQRLNSNDKAKIKENDSILFDWFGY
jgi:hypothetical protein